MAAHTKTWTVDNTAYVAVTVDTHCNHVSVYENVRAATTNLLVKGNIPGDNPVTKLAGEKIDFVSRGFTPGDIVGYVKAASVLTATMAQEEDYDI